MPVSSRKEEWRAKTHHMINIGTASEKNLTDLRMTSNRRYRQGTVALGIRTVYTGDFGYEIYDAILVTLLCGPDERPSLVHIMHGISPSTFCNVPFAFLELAGRSA